MQQIAKLEKLNITFHNPTPKEDTVKILTNFLSELMWEDTENKQNCIH